MKKFLHCLLLANFGIHSGCNKDPQSMPVNAGETPKLPSLFGINF